MDVAGLDTVTPFVTKDGSTIRELHHTELQSLAEASLDDGQSTQRHYHAATEEIYFVVEGRGQMELDGEHRELGPGEAVLIPPGAWHELRAIGALQILCCCSPPYSDDDTFFE